ncbi:malonic semialdehyde reductase [Halomonas urumqiensis]|uniref:Putative NADH dehydrogenase/NAD(P)H nitroreductase C1H70_06015 n=1 Tax=Halomonas urumqiensis TaxID=1684789 RepID=A0A2N7ULD7_9GAMM|nr:malonic semialdehyde reductase [Halomonas urumqiensis]PMR81260.1 malonic semialdehyde reductase [Halomonas urumqiensis]PTB01729.1 malonic semialdehyde reductase [Halomonas urumqiensis]GHE22178.1 putative NADH dehydrogenase/NAD(P)H nitroreductase [Halomonas urumqiensis]
MTAINQTAIATLFTEARTHNVWQDREVSEQTLRELYELMHFGPTSMNCQPTRILFLTTDEAKQRLKPALMPGNQEKTMKSPVVAVLGFDTEFHEHLPRMFAHNKDAKSLFEGKPDFIHTTAFRNSAIQGGYFILAARAVGLDAGPMSGFNNAAVDEEFFPDGKVKSNFLCNLGYGDAEALFPRGDRFTFDEVCKVL